MGVNIAVQMGINGYGIFGDLPERSLTESLVHVRRAGATGIEIMTNVLRDPDALRESCDEMNLDIVALHVFWSELSEEILAKVRDLRIPRLICSGIPVKNSADLMGTIPAVRKWSAEAQRVGAQFLVHNHEEECLPSIDGRTPLEAIAEQTVHENVGFVIDVYWATRAGADLGAVFSAVADRCDYVHFKDGVRAGGGDNPQSYGLGDGEVDLDYAWSSANRNGQLSWAVVERDYPAPDPAAAVRHDVFRLRSYANTPTGGV